MPDEPQERFTLVVGNWYAVEIHEGSVGENCSYSPILIEGIIPAGSGKRVFSLSFYHAAYPEGVRDKIYTLKTIERTEQHLLSLSMDHEPNRYLLISPISWQWMREHYRNDLNNEAVDIQRWLGQNA